MTDAEKQIREALAAETRPGDWRISKHRDGRNVLIYDADGFEVARVCYPNRDANAAFIIACHPAAISELLDEMERLRAENEILALDEIRFNWLAARLEDVQIDDADPNDHYYGDEEDVPYPVLWRRAIDAARGIT